MERGSSHLEKLGKDVLREVHGMATEEGLADTLEEKENLSPMAAKILETPGLVLGEIKKQSIQESKPVANEPIAGKELLKSKLDDAELFDVEFQKTQAFLKAGWKATNPHHDLFLREGLKLKGEEDVYILAHSPVTNKGPYSFEYFYTYIPRDEMSKPIKYPDLATKDLVRADDLVRAAQNIEYTIFQVKDGVLQRIGSTGLEKKAETQKLPEFDASKPLDSNQFEDDIQKAA